MLVHANISAKEVVKESIKIAADICIYTNKEIFIEEL
jgi:ATP-dependent HslUV protease subunit HslV